MFILSFTDLMHNAVGHGDFKREPWIWLETWDWAATHAKDYLLTVCREASAVEDYPQRIQREASAKLIFVAPIRAAEFSRDLRFIEFELRHNLKANSYNVPL
jgi:hypothetical protein